MYNILIILINYEYIFFRFGLNEAHTNIEAMSRLTDHILYDIQYSHDPNLEEAKSLLNRLHTRHLYKFIGSYNLIFVSIMLIFFKFNLISGKCKLNTVKSHINKQSKNHTNC